MIPVQTLETFDIFGDPSSQVSPAPAKYAQGYLPGEVLPAQHENFFLGKSSRCVTQLRDGLSSVENELVNIVTAGGATPDASTNNQVLAAINYLIAAAEARAKLAAHPKGELWWTSEPPTITVEGVEQPNPEGDPQLLFGGGTWVRIKDTFVWAAGDSDTVTKNVYTAESGSFTTLIGTNNLPKHAHGMSHYHDKGTMRIVGSIISGGYSLGSNISSDTTSYGALSAGNFNKKTAGGSSTNATYMSKIELDTNFTNAWVGRTSNGYTAQSGGSVRTETDNNTTTETALSVKNPLIKRFCWQRTA